MLKISNNINWNPEHSEKEMETMLEKKTGYVITQKDDEEIWKDVKIEKLTLSEFWESEGLEQDPDMTIDDVADAFTVIYPDRDEISTMVTVLDDEDITMKRLSLEDFTSFASGGESRQRPGTAVTYVLINDPEDEENELFYTEWDFVSEDDDFEKAITAYAEYLQADQGIIEWEGKTLFLTTQADFTGRLLPYPKNYHDVKEYEMYDFEMMAQGYDETGTKISVYWIFEDVKGNQKELDEFDYNNIDRVELVE